MVPDLTTWGLSEVVTAVVTIIFLYVVMKDFLVGKKKPKKPIATPQPQKTPQQKEEPDKSKAEPAPVATSKEEKKPEGEDKQKAAEVSEEGKEKKEEVASKEKDDLDNLLDEVFDDMDTEENIVDQAWDNVTYGREVSVKVNVMDQIKESHKKALDEEKERKMAAAKEKSAEEKRIEQATAIRIEGNVAFKKQNFEAAIRHYSKAIRLFPPGHYELYLLYANRSIANKEAGNIKEALADAESCIKINPTFAKGHLRKAAALESDSDWGTAKSIYQHILSKFTSAGDLQARNVASVGIKRCDEKLEDLLNC